MRTKYNVIIIFRLSSPHLPQFNRVTAFALVVETVDPIDTRAFVVPPDAEEVLRILKFVC